MKRISFGLALLAVFAGGVAHADALKDDAVARLVASHDPAIPVAIGRVYIKQAGLRAARTLLAARGAAANAGSGWSAQAPEWIEQESKLAATVDRIIARDLENGTWLRAAWAAEAQRILSAEEADEIAAHFATASGAEQREVVEMLLVGETLMAAYTFTDRIRYDVKGSEAEIKALQTLWWEHQPFRNRDLTGDPSSVRFASLDPGVKYCKMLAIQGIEQINLHYADVLKRIDRELAAATPEVDAEIARFRERSTKN